MYRFLKVFLSYLILYFFREVMNNVNGILLPGGQSLFNVSGGYADAGNIIYRIAKEVNKLLLWL